LVEALGGGLNGIVASLRGSSLTRTLLRLPADVVAAQPRISLDVATTWVRGSFDVVVEVARLRDGRVRVLRVAELGLDARGLLEAADIFRFNVSRVAAGGAVEGSFVPSGDVPKVAALLQAAGIRLENSTFSRPPSR
jgi:pilus assembly protein CpaF